jgi:radical SAM-linked protein
MPVFRNPWRVVAAPLEEAEVIRVRIIFAKAGALRFVGHLDLHTIWERSLRRAGLPLAYTQGFHPGPRLQIASALPLGISGKAEIVDAWLDEEAGNDRLPDLDMLQKCVPPGLRILSIEAVDFKAPALQTCVVSAGYEVAFLELADLEKLKLTVDVLLSKTVITRQRRGKEYDLRSLVERLETLPPDDSGMSRLEMQLAARPGATGRPEEVLDALGIPLDTVRIERTRLILVIPT